MDLMLPPINIKGPDRNIFSDEIRKGNSAILSKMFSKFALQSTVISTAEKIIPRLEIPPIKVPQISPKSNQDLHEAILVPALNIL
jgi:hypothetical protein